MRRTAPLLTLLVLAACSSSPSRPAEPKDDAPRLDLEAIRQQSRNLQLYVDAMLLCGSTEPADWEKAKRQFEALQPMFVFNEDPDLIRQFRAGSESARKELARRGVLLRSMLVFGSGQYDRSKWDEARKILMDAGEPGQFMLVTTLLKLLVNEQFQDLRPHLRFTLCDSGKMALETSVQLARQQVQEARANAPIFNLDGLVQVLMVIAGFGDAGRPALEEFVKSPKPNVRGAVARAIGESRDGSGAPILITLLNDPEYPVRAMAAEAAGALASAKGTVGPALVDRIGKERDPKVLQRVLRSIGDLYYAEAVPDLMRVVEVPSRELAESAMQALYIITGERFLRREQWQEWYRTKYADWKKRKDTPKKEGAK